MEILREQLPGAGCERRKDRPFMRTDCSFSAATSCGSVPYWFHEHLVEGGAGAGGDGGEEEQDDFTAILVGCNNAYDAIDLLRLATRGTEPRYDRAAWREEFLRTDDPNGAKVEERKSDCPVRTVPLNNPGRIRKPHIYGIEAMPKTYRQLEKTKAALGYLDDELDFTHLAVASDRTTVRVDVDKSPIAADAVGIVTWDKACGRVPKDDETRCQTVPADRIDNWIQTKPRLADDHPDGPIHYMSVTVLGNDYEVLKGAARTLSRVQYLDLGYHWYGDWGSSHRSLKDLMYRLEKKGFACYWPGDTGNMWRITGCWQDHYELRFYANIACVNTNIPAARPLLDRMERMFRETLAKPNLRFGV
jgi:hypothetical protein